MASPAASTNEQDLSQQLLARLEFENLGLQFIGVATFGGQTSCFLKLPGAAAPQTYQQGDRVGDFEIVEIRSDMIILESRGIQFPLTLGAGGDETGSVEKTPPADALVVAAPEEETGPMTAEAVEQLELKAVIDNARQPVTKQLETQLKSRTAKYAVAKLVDDAWEVAGVATARKQSGPQFIWPINGKVTSAHGYRRDPMGGGQRMHSGIDIATSIGTPVRAAASGIVSRVAYNGTLGRHIYIRHDDGFETRYGHLSAQLVKEGQRVSQGDIIGREGNTGKSTGPHLHFEIRKDGRSLDPIYYLPKK